MVMSEVLWNGAPGLLVARHVVAERYVARLVRDNALEFFRRLGLHDETCVKEQVLSASHERIQAVVLDDVDVHVRRL
jgi:hypothetical protein